MERNAEIYAPETVFTILFFESLISASIRAGITAIATETTDRSRVYSMPCTKKLAYFGRKEKLKKLDGDMFLKSSVHHIGISFLQTNRMCRTPGRSAHPCDYFV